MIERGDVTNSSFGFDVLDERWNVSENADEPVIREVLETRLYEVSPTAFPAYQDSTVMAERSFRNLAHMSGLDLNELIDDTKEKMILAGCRTLQELKELKVRGV